MHYHNFSEIFGNLCLITAYFCQHVMLSCQYFRISPNLFLDSRTCRWVLQIQVYPSTHFKHGFLTISSLLFYFFCLKLEFIKQIKVIKKSLLKIIFIMSKIKGHFWDQNQPLNFSLKRFCRFF